MVSSSHGHLPEPNVDFVLLAIAALRKKNYVHGDISVNNILIDDSGGSKDELWNGLLVDFDYAISNDGEDGRTVRIGCNILHEPTINAIDILQGTIPCMAIELLRELKSVKHEFYHDLESLSYVICYICCIYAGPNYTLQDDLNVLETAIAKWFGTKEQSESQIGREKYETVSNSEDFEDMILPIFYTYFAALKPYMKN
jgi:serine/threonine protein kinase